MSILSNPLPGLFLTETVSGTDGNPTELLLQSCRHGSLSWSGITLPHTYLNQVLPEGKQPAVSPRSPSPPLWMLPWAPPWAPPCIRPCSSSLQHLVCEALIKRNTSLVDIIAECQSGDTKSSGHNIPGIDSMQVLLLLITRAGHFESLEKNNEQTRRWNGCGWSLSLR